MARIIENGIGRRLIKISTDDIFSIIKEYQKIISNTENKTHIREILNKAHFYLPEEV